MYSLGLILMITASAMCSLLAFMELMLTGAPLMGIVLFGCGACFVGGWILLAQELLD